MSLQVVLGQADEVFGGRGSFARKYLGIDMAADLLDTDFIEARFCRD